MRVISGLAKGHKLKAPKGNAVRPTEDRIKESLFNIIGNIKSDTVVLDAFGGSGSIGIEFLSRGAKKSYFVDNYKESISAIEDNLKHTKLLENAEIIKTDIFIALKKFKSKKIKFDYIYLDPPFNREGLIDKVFKSIDKLEVLNENGIIIVEHESKLSLLDKLHGFKKIDHRSYGSKSIDFYRENIEEAPNESSLSGQF